MMPDAMPNNTISTSAPTPMLSSIPRLMDTDVPPPLHMSSNMHIPRHGKANKMMKRDDRKGNRGYKGNPLLRATGRLEFVPETVYGSSSIDHNTPPFLRILGEKETEIDELKNNNFNLIHRVEKLNTQVGYLQDQLQKTEEAVDYSQKDKYDKLVKDFKDLKAKHKSESEELLVTKNQVTQLNNQLKQKESMENNNLCHRNNSLKSELQNALKYNKQLIQNDDNLNEKLIAADKKNEELQQERDRLFDKCELTRQENTRLAQSLKDLQVPSFAPSSRSEIVSENKRLKAIYDQSIDEIKALQGELEKSEEKAQNAEQLFKEKLRMKLDEQYAVFVEEGLRLKNQSLYIKREAETNVLNAKSEIENLKKQLVESKERAQKQLNEQNAKFEEERIQLQNENKYIKSETEKLLLNAKGIIESLQQQVEEAKKAGGQKYREPERRRERSDYNGANRHSRERSASRGRTENYRRHHPYRNNEDVRSRENTERTRRY